MDWGSHLLEAIQALGYCRQGPAPVDYQEIRAWQELTGSQLTPWETETVFALSDRYVAQRYKSADKRTNAPYWPIPENANVDDKFRQLARRKKNG